jgi:hypothetical protein
VQHEAVAEEFLEGCMEARFTLAVDRVEEGEGPAREADRDEDVDA